MGEADWRDFADYEAVVDSVIGQYRMLAICTYSLDRCGASDVIDVVSNHRFALIRREGEWQSVESSERKRAEEALVDAADDRGERWNTRMIGRVQEAWLDAY